MWDRFKADIIGPRASVQPLAGWLLALLFGFVVYLTLVYAPGAFERAQLADGADPAGVIPVWAGYLTVGLVSAITLLVAFEPWRRWLASARARRPNVVVAFFVAAPGAVLSAVDTLLVRGVATWVGAAHPSTAMRNTFGIVFVIAVAGTALFAPPPWGLVAALLGIVAVIAVVRRWSWIEGDRETFLIERGIRAGAMRIGFAEDLRDEALVGIVCLFLLIPLLLRQISLIDSAAFALEDGLPDGAPAQFLAWLGYFGAELAKSVPFVDWSEVFHVANDSPIEPGNALGAQVVFGMRATLDLMLLAAVVQAVGIATRIADQNEAFRNNRLPILEPFSEARELTRVGAAIEPALEIHAAEQHAVTAFPAYDRARLIEVMRDPTAKPDARAAAVALLVAQHPGDATTAVIHEQAQREPEGAIKASLIREANPLAPQCDGAAETDRATLYVFVQNPYRAPSDRRAAARRLGRLGFGQDHAALLREVLNDKKNDIGVRADIAVALSKHAATPALREEVAELAKQCTEADIISALATAHALARLDVTPRDAAQSFIPALQPHAERAASVQCTPLAIDAAKTRDIGSQTEQMVAIRPGADPFGASFILGAPYAADDGSRKDQTPPTAITMTRPFAFGRFPVTNREYAGYSTAMNLPPVEGADRLDMPVVNITWHDAIAYAAWLERFTGERYRLPSEAEWEYVCRAGAATPYWWGADWEDARIPGSLSAVNALAPNPWGVWDLYGNVYEWCADVWHPSHEDRPRTQEPWLDGGDRTRRVVRAGSWSYPTGARRRELRSSYRNERQATATATNFGFRLVRNLD